jgi:hypothetical protein
MAFKNLFANVARKEYLSQNEAGGFRKPEEELVSIGSRIFKNRVLGTVQYPNSKQVKREEFAALLFQHGGVPSVKEGERILAGASEGRLASCWYQNPGIMLNVIKGRIEGQEVYRISVSALDLGYEPSDE